MARLDRYCISIPRAGSLTCDPYHHRGPTAHSVFCLVAVGEREALTTRSLVHRSVDCPTQVNMNVILTMLS